LPKIDVARIAPRKGSAYPGPFAQHAAGRSKRALGDAVGLRDFGINLVTLPPGAWSSQRHWHSAEDEFAYVLSGEMTLVTDAGATLMRAGECAGFAREVPDGHHFINHSNADVVYIEVGARAANDVCHYPDIDLHSDYRDEWFSHKDGTPYPRLDRG
jgi:uncharacterized cupin superfamily protein